MDSLKLKQQVRGIHSSIHGSLQMYWPLAWCFCGTPNRGCECISDSLPVSGWDSFPSIGLPNVAFGCPLLKVCSVLKGKGQGEDLGEWGSGGSERNRGMDCMREESNSIKKKYPVLQAEVIV